MPRMTDQNLASPLSPRRRRSIWTRLTRSIHGSMDWNSAPPLTAGLREGFAEILGREPSNQEEGRGRREGGREGRRTYVPPTVEEEEEEEQRGRGRGRGRERERERERGHGHARRGGVNEGRPQGAVPQQNERARYGSRTAQAPPRQVSRQEGGYQGDQQGELHLARLESALSNWALYEDPRGRPSLAAGPGPTVRSTHTARPRPGLNDAQASAQGPTPAQGSAPTFTNAPTSAYPNPYAAALARQHAHSQDLPTRGLVHPKTQGQPIPTVYPDHLSHRTQSLRCRPSRSQLADEPFISELPGSSNTGPNCQEGEIPILQDLQDYRRAYSPKKQAQEASDLVDLRGYHRAYSPQTKAQVASSRTTAPVVVNYLPEGKHAFTLAQTQPSHLPPSPAYAPSHLPHSPQPPLPHPSQHQLSQLPPTLALAIPHLPHHPRILQLQNGQVLELSNGLIIPLPAPQVYTPPPRPSHPSALRSPSYPFPYTALPSPPLSSAGHISVPGTPDSDGMGSSFSFRPPTPTHPSSTQQRPERSRSHSPCSPLSLREAQIEGLKREVRRRRDFRVGAVHVARVAEAVAVGRRVGRRVRREVRAYFVEWAEAQEESAKRGVDLEVRVRKWARGCVGGV